jgi:hypothetical protein
VHSVAPRPTDLLTSRVRPAGPPARGFFFAGNVLAPFSRHRYRARMPRDGALTLSDVRSPTLSIVCGPCARRGRYAVARLLDGTRRRKAARPAADARRLPKGALRERLRPSVGRSMSGRCRNHRVSSFRGLPQSATAPTRNCGNGRGLRHVEDGGVSYEILRHSGDGGPR